MKVLCFGSLNIDYTYRVDHFVGKGETLAAESLQVFSGGKGLNQAIALAHAGAETWMAGAVGEDGRFLLEELAAADVRTDHVSILQQVRTGNAIIQNDKTGDNCILLYGGANRAVTEAQADAALGHFGAGDWLLLQNEINQLPYIMRQAHARGMKIAFNPSPMEARVLDFPLEYVDLFLLNRVEAAQLAGQDGAADDLLRVLREQFPGAAVVLTLGEQGAVYADSEQTIRQAAYPAEAVDTTAAGDTFTGFFLASLLRGEGVPQAMERAARAAAIAVTRRGAAPSIPTLAELRTHSA
ncbi:ribokinase [Agathobaculum sp.]|uniref:ribokinase n=1 Tax=Agathobaculum sp. TaxID=2048138 RepID=UPI00399F60E3